MFRLSAKVDNMVINSAVEVWREWSEAMARGLGGGSKSNVAASMGKRVSVSSSAGGVEKGETK